MPKYSQIRAQKPVQLPITGNEIFLVTQDGETRGMILSELQNAAVDTTGTAISFDRPRIYGSDSNPETGNVTIVTTGLIKGMTQLLIHNNGSEPSFAAGIKIISGAYATGELNYIFLLAISSSSVLVSITQEV